MKEVFALFIVAVVVAAVAGYVAMAVSWPIWILFI